MSTAEAKSILPPPPVDADADLTAFEYMPLHVRRLRDSGIAAASHKAAGEEFRAAVLLWCAAWHQVPASSLPNDDAELSGLAGYGRAVREWQRVKRGALRGWYECSDGLLYHEILAEVACTSWRARLEDLHRRYADRVRKQNRDRKEKGLEAGEIMDFETWNSARRRGGVPAEMMLMASGIPPENALKERKGKVREGNNSKSNALPSPAEKPPDVGDARPPPELKLNGNGSHAPGEPPAKSREITDASKRILAFLNQKTGSHFREVAANLGPISARLRESSEEEIRAVVARKCRDWLTDPEMRKHLNPETLFRPGKFHKYLGEVPPAQRTLNAD